MHTNSLARTASWVIREIATGRVVCETFEPRAVELLNKARYEAVPDPHLSPIPQYARLKGPPLCRPI